MIDTETLDRVFAEQRLLTDNVLDNQLDLDSYISNMGFDPKAVYRFAYEYANDNFGDQDEDLRLRIGSAIGRVLLVGFMVAKVPGQKEGYGFISGQELESDKTDGQEYANPDYDSDHDPGWDPD